MSEYDIALERNPKAVDELLRKVSVLREDRPAVHADVVHPGIAAAITDPQEEKSESANRSLKDDFDKA